MFQVGLPNEEGMRSKSCPLGGREGSRMGRSGHCPGFDPALHVEWYLDI